MKWKTLEFFNDVGKPFKFTKFIFQIEDDQTYEEFMQEIRLHFPNDEIRIVHKGAEIIRCKPVDLTEVPKRNKGV